MTQVSQYTAEADLKRPKQNEPGRQKLEGRAFLVSRTGVQRYNYYELQESAGFKGEHLIGFSAETTLNSESVVPDGEVKIR